MLLATSVEKLGISKQLVTWEYQRVVQYSEEDFPRPAGRAMLKYMGEVS